MGVSERIARLATRAPRESLSDRVDDLGEGDRLDVEAAVQLNAPLGGKLAAKLSVKHEDGDYFVEGELDAKVGVALNAQLGVAKLGAELYAGGALSATFRYDEVDDAQKAVEALVPFGKGDTDDLDGALTRLELQANLNTELEAKLGGLLRVQAKVRLDPSVSYAIVFGPDGNQLERVQQLQARLDAKATARLEAAGALLAPDLGKAQGTVTATWTTRIDLPEDLDASDVAKTLAFVADLGGLADELHGATHEFSAKWETELRKPGDDLGRTVSVDASDVSIREALRALGQAATGDVDGVLSALGEGATVKTRKFVERGADWEFDAGLGGVGVELAWRNEVRDYDD